MKSAIFAFLAAAALTGCGNEMGPAGPETSNASVAAVDIPDACTFFSKAELETAVGTELRDGEAQSVQEGSSCSFRKQLGRDATRSIPGSPLPASLGFNSVTISTAPYDPTAVAEIRELDPSAFDTVPNVGDDAYFLGPNLLHVRVGNRGFSVRMEPEAQSPDDQAKVRVVMLALGRMGATRLQT